MKRHLMTVSAVILAFTFLIAGFSTGEERVGIKKTDDAISGSPVQAPADEKDALSENKTSEDKAVAANKAGEQIKWQVISAGGTKGSSTNYIVQGTVAQTAVGSGSSDDYIINHGYWQVFETGPCDCEPGNCNGDATTNILDITYMISYLYKGGPVPTPYPVCSGDPNCNCTVNILDITFLINYLYKGGPLPCLCSDWTSTCGPL